MSDDTTHHPFDRGSLEAWRHATVEFAQAVLGRQLPPGTVPELTKLEQSPLDADGIVSDADATKIHVERQSYHDPAIGLRMARYFLALVQHHQGPPPEQYLVLLCDRADRPELGTYTLGSLSLSYQVIRLWHIDPERLLAHPELAGLASLAKADTPEDRTTLLIRAGKLIRAKLPQDRAASALEWAAVLATLYLQPQAVEDALRRNDMPVDLSHSYLAVQSRQEGHEQGLREGRDEGLHEGRREMVRRVLDRRFGDAALTDRVSEIPDELLLEAHDRAVAEDADDFTAWLNGLQG